MRDFEFHGLHLFTEAAVMVGPGTISTFAESRFAYFPTLQFPHSFHFLDIFSKFLQSQILFLLHSGSLDAAVMVCLGVFVLGKIFVGKSF